MEGYLNTTLALLALAFVAAVIVFGVKERFPRVAHISLSGELADIELRAK
jgi:hypothetical protein